MISVERAKQILFRNTPSPKKVRIKVAEAPGYVLSEKIHSPIPVPIFDNSAMDGYALRADDVNHHEYLEIIGEVRAGKNPAIRVKKGTAVRINTGAAIPKGADSVLVKEQSIEKRRRLYVKGFVSKGDNIRRKGDEIVKGEKVLKENIQISPRTVAFLSSMGIRHVRVYKKPSVSLIVTGSELRKPGTRLIAGQIYDSASDALYSALSTGGAGKISMKWAEDNEKAVLRIFENEAGRSDVIIFSGGISGGDHDYVIKVLTRLRVHTLFHKVAQKPGKPLYAGTYRKKLIFGLPGNPAAALICLYEYVIPALRIMGGAGAENRRIRAVVNDFNGLKRINGKALFLKGTLTDKGVSILSGQESYKLKSLADSNCIVYVPRNRRRLKSGMIADVLAFPAE